MDKTWTQEEGEARIEHLEKEIKEIGHRLVDARLTEASLCGSDYGPDIIDRMEKLLTKMNEEIYEEYIKDGLKLVVTFHLGNGTINLKDFEVLSCTTYLNQDQELNYLQISFRAKEV